MSGYHKREQNEFEPFPVHKLKRVDRPTILIEEDKVKRSDEREQGFSRARRGDFGSKIQKEVDRFVKKQPNSGALMNMASHLRNTVDSVVAPVKIPISEDPAVLTRNVKEFAYFLRADIVGICALPSYAVYSHSFSNGEPIELNHQYAIAILIDQDWRTARATTGHDWVSNSMSFIAYSTSGFIACIVADYIRRLGYHARAHHAANYQVVVPPILLWAGLGEMGRMSECVINPFLGPRFKAAVVTTNMPLVPDKPIDFGLQDFCSKCKKCARECPSGAISMGDEKVIYNGYERWPMDSAKCTRYRVGNQLGAGCGVCLKVCPWNKPYTPFHRAVGWTMRHSSLARGLAIWGDDFMGYGKPHYEDKWWFDLEEQDGVLIKARTEKREYSSKAD